MKLIFRSRCLWYKWTDNRSSQISGTLILPLFHFFQVKENENGPDILLPVIRKILTLLCMVHFTDKKQKCSKSWYFCFIGASATQIGISLDFIVKGKKIQHVRVNHLFIHSRRTAQQHFYPNHIEVDFSLIVCLKNIFWFETLTWFEAELLWWEHN